jgi:cytochrome c biogenesis protein CcmG/thiol:disulfide interchange protein DsbE
MNRRILSVGLILIVPLLGVLYANLGRDPHSIASPLIGQAAPPFELRPVGGGPSVSLEGLRGTPVVVNFWATWCVPCAEEHGALVKAAQDLGSGVQFLGVVYEDDEKRAADFLTERGKPYPSLMDADGKTAISYGVFGVPETYFIDRSGTIVAKFVGPLDPETLAGYVRLASGPQS